MMIKRILVADDHSVVRKGLVQVLREGYPDAFIGEASNGNEVFELAHEDNWDLIMLDISMPGRNGIDALKQLKHNGIKTPVLILSMHPEDQYAIRVLRAGASGYLNKEAAPEVVLEAVERVLSGRKYITAEIAEKMAGVISQKNDKSGHEALSDREMQVLQLIASGKTVTQIANEMSLSVNTVSTYRARLLEKLSLNNNAELTRYSIDHNLG